MQLGLATLILSAVSHPDLFQPALSALWSSLYQSAFYRASTFETFLTVLSYGLIEPRYTRKFAHSPSLRIDLRERGTSRSASSEGANNATTKGNSPQLPKMKRPSKRLGEIFTYIAPLLLLDLTLIKKFSGVPVEDIRTAGGYSAVPSKNIDASFLFVTVHNFSWASPVQLVRALPHEPPTSRRLVIEVISSFFIYDTLFFLAHVGFHRISALQPYHLPHHTHQEIHPQVTNKLSITERLSLVLLANFSLNVIGSHVLSRTIFVPVFVWLLVEAHCGMDLPLGYEKILPKGWGSGAKEHSRHHRTGRGSYAPFFTWWDMGL
ncbi:uncharacterized protein A1O9_12454, partial [Exophiala aquamarina CBS 119918]